MRPVALLWIALAGCVEDGELMADSLFVGEVRQAALKHGVLETEDASLEVDFLEGGGEQHAHVLFEGVLRRNGETVLDGPEERYIHGIYLLGRELFAEFELDGEQVRAVGMFRAGRSVLDLDLSVKVPPLGYVEVGSITLHREAEPTSADTDGLQE